VPTLFIAIAQTAACPPMAVLGGALSPCTWLRATPSTGASSTVTVAPTTAVIVMPKMISASERGNARKALPEPSTATQRQAPAR
jgi:hypothetical protein